MEYKGRGRKGPGKLIASLWCQGTKRHTYDPGGPDGESGSIVGNWRESEADSESEVLGGGNGGGKSERKEGRAVKSEVAIGFGSGRIGKEIVSDEACREGSGDDRKKNNGNEWKSGIWQRKKGKKAEGNGMRQELVLGTTALTRNKARLFPTTRRPITREVPDSTIVSETEVNNWFQTTAWSLGDHFTSDQRAKAITLLYTWRDVFETDLLRIGKAHLMEHAIILMPSAVPYHTRIPLYTEEEIAFCHRLLPKMEEAGLIFRCDSDWGGWTKFLLKPRADTLPQEARLRMVNNFIPLNRVSEKSQYPCPRIEQIIYTVLKKGKRWLFTSDTANSYWAIPVRAGDETKLGFVTPYVMYCYNVMGQGVTGGTHTYSRFRDRVFGAIPEGFEDSSRV